MQSLRLMATKFSDRGEAALATCDADLQAIARLALKWTDGYVDWDIVQGARTIEQQQAYFDTQKSKVNPKAYATREALYKAAKHITGPGMPYSRAFDYVLQTKQPGGGYDKPALCLVAGYILAAAAHLGIKVRWGADWDQDGSILEAGTFQDLPHFELAS